LSSSQSLADNVTDGRPHLPALFSSTHTNTSV